jgi:hypothetical protein
MEIEFYWNSPKHPDTSVNKRECNVGKISFFCGGKRRRMDISFKSDAESYGGILLRGIKNLKTGQIIAGPNKVKKIIFQEEHNNIVIDDICKNNQLCFKGCVVTNSRINIKDKIRLYNYSFISEDSQLCEQKEAVK